MVIALVHQSKEFLKINKKVEEDLTPNGPGKRIANWSKLSFIAKNVLGSLRTIDRKKLLSLLKMRTRGLRDWKIRPGVKFFPKASRVGLTNLCNQEHV